jgi:hypothetical protein
MVSMGQMTHTTMLFFFWGQNYPLNSKTFVKTIMHIVFSCFVLSQLVVGHREGREFLTLLVTKKRKK